MDSLTLSDLDSLLLRSNSIYLDSTHELRAGLGLRNAVEVRVEHGAA